MKIFTKNWLDKWTALDYIVVSICVVIVLVTSVFGYRAIRSDKEPLAPLTTEQQDLVSELQTAVRGDIIVDPNGTLVGEHMKYFIVRGFYVHEKDNQFSIPMAQMNTFGIMMLPEYWDQDELIRANVRLVKVDEDEWTKIIQEWVTWNPADSFPR